MLEIGNLRGGINGKTILNGIDLSVGAGEIHAIMGPNGSGKSTLAQVLAGHPSYEVVGGTVTFEGKDLLQLEPEQRACEGLFMAFQYPAEIRGVSNAYFLCHALNAKRRSQGLTELDPLDFRELLEEKLDAIGWNDEFADRPVNEGFSGGEKKRNEILQMAVLEPKLAVLDEPDSGLDIDALKSVAGAVNKLRNADSSMLLITHYQRLLDYIVPDHIHVLVDGQFVLSGGKELAYELEAKGYDWVKAPAVVA